LPQELGEFEPDDFVYQFGNRKGRIGIRCAVRKLDYIATDNVLLAKKGLQQI